jgi:biopolymer transport protein ExbD
MKCKRSTKLLIEPPAVATGDIAFNLIVFFLVCASSSPDSGRKQNLPASESKSEARQNTNINVAMSRGGVSIDGGPVRLPDFLPRMRKLLAAKPRAEERIVVVKSAPDVSYDHWIKITGWIEEAGGMITLQIEEERTVSVQ